jgi:hypothetical protein
MLGILTDHIRQLPPHNSRQRRMDVAAGLFADFATCSMPRFYHA